MFQLAPASSSVVGNYLLKHREQGRGIDGFALSHGRGTSRLVVVTGGNDPRGGRKAAGVAHEDVYVGLRGKPRTDRALHHRVKLEPALEGFRDPPCSPLGPFPHPAAESP